jgi:phosphoribosylformylglycinamidine cyclo-ligase
VDREEMYRVFNMGIGMVVFVRRADVLAALAALRRAGERAVPIGNVRAAARASVELAN